jgi:hypothetical protein
MITKRTLERWRREALSFKRDVSDLKEAEPVLELCERILRLPQILLDQHLMRGK